MFVQIDPRKTRAYTCALLDMVDQGLVDRDHLIQDLLGWMSEADVAEFARRNEYIQDEQDQDE
jgi:hypothetical protein